MVRAEAMLLRIQSTVEVGLGLSRDMFDSFLQYQSRMRDTFRRLQRHYGFDLIDAERPVERISADLQNKIETVLAGG